MASIASCGGMNKAADAPGATMAPNMGPEPPMPEQRAQEPGQERPRHAALVTAARPATAPEQSRGDGAGEWAVVREFPVPDYSQPYDGPRSDFRETVYWNPAVRTDANGRASVKFYLSDSITSFRATAEGLGGTTPGHSETLIKSRLPISIAAKLPLEASRGDIIELPVTLTNTTDRGLSATTRATLGSGLRLVRGGLERRVRLARRGSKTLYFRTQVIGDDGKVALAVEGGGMSDAMERTMTINPPGFPQRRDVAGRLLNAARHDIELPAMVPGSLRASITLYPTPVASLVKGTEALIREPHGCFEQASSANYPNVMVMSYLAANDAADPALVARTRGYLDNGYKKLTGYESPSRGYEWFGADPGHEALTAYGLMQFAEMTKVYDVDPDMVARTQAWLLGRRDGQGGYNTKKAGYHSWANDELTGLYITYALTETGAQGLEKELDAAAALAGKSDDPYILALAAGALHNGGDQRAADIVRKLSKKQIEDGSYPGARNTITNSGGRARDIETTALATIALLEAGGHGSAVDRGIAWLTERRAAGSFASTQATVLALKALTLHSQSARLPAGTRIDVMVDGQKAASLELSEEHMAGATLEIPARFLRPGKNALELRMAQASEGVELPYSATVHYRVARGQSSAGTAVAVQTRLRSPRATRMGKPVRISAVVQNVTGEAQPNVMARVGIPGGAVFQTWQLDELKERGVIDFYETRPREVILYFRSLAPRERRQVNIQLLAAVPGTYTAPPSTAYLYYTDEHKHWTDPLALTVRRPWRRPKNTAKKSSTNSAAKSSAEKGTSHANAR
nr:alpha-2-macroglobulin family protein [uncultured Brevundimonas sp.]